MCYSQRKKIDGWKIFNHIAGDYVFVYILVIFFNINYLAILSLGNKALSVLVPTYLSSFTSINRLLLFPEIHSC